ncbi:MAG: methyltransferase domain-containing protein [Planctomycetota bacterium]
MRSEHLKLLACPECGGELALEAFEWDREGVLAGALGCAREHLYPVIGGIPRFTPGAAFEHGEFAASFGGRFPCGPPARVDRVWRRTSESFALQWLTYDVIREDEDRATFYAKTGLGPEELAGALVLDAGCGSGRYARVATAAGAQVVAVDLSRACERAQEALRDFPGTLVVQANLMMLPFRKGIFDVVYSIGVLHHTPNTRKALAALAPFVRPGGTLAVWVYAKRDPVFEAVNRIARGITTRMSYGALMRLARLAVPLGAAKRWALRRGWTAWLSRTLPPCSSHPDPQVRVCDTFDWYSPEFQWHHTEEELARWLRELGFEKLVSLSHRDAVHRFQGQGVCYRARSRG